MILQNIELASQLKLGQESQTVFYGSQDTDIQKTCYFARLDTEIGFVLDTHDLITCYIKGRVNNIHT